MKNKIELFQEILQADPTSKVFYPLAKLLQEAGQLDQAADALRQGLTRHPDHLEARLLLVDILHAEDAWEEASQEAGRVADKLAPFTAFWELWAERLAGRDPDLAVAVRFMATRLDGEPISWSQVLEMGLTAALKQAGMAAPEAAQGQPKPDLEVLSGLRKVDEIITEPGPEIEPDAPETSMSLEEGEEPSLRTRTMAELLVSQEDYQGALDIYAEIAKRAEGEQLASVQSRMAAIRSRMGKGRAGRSAETAAGSKVFETAEAASDALDAEEGADEAEMSAGSAEPRAASPTADRVLSTLGRLAERLQARAEAAGRPQ